MKNFKVFITHDLISSGIELLKSNNITINKWPGPYPISKSNLISGAAGHDGILCSVADNIDDQIIDSLPSLNIISNNAVGFDNIDITHAKSRNIFVSNTPNTLSQSVAELTITLLLCYSKNILKFNNWLRDGQWKTWEPTLFLGNELFGKTIGIIGMGEIGKRVASICYSFGMRVMYHSRSDIQDIDVKYQTCNSNLSYVLQSSDFISVHLDLNQNTKNFFNYKEFIMMKDSAVFINTSRGPIHSENDLIKALNNKLISGAVLDVTNPEPIKQDSPLLNMGNVLITPHIGSATVEARNKMALTASWNIIDASRGIDPRNSLY